MKYRQSSSGEIAIYSSSTFRHSSSAVNSALSSAIPLMLVALHHMRKKGVEVPAGTAAGRALAITRLAMIIFKA